MVVRTRSVSDMAKSVAPRNVPPSPARLFSGSVLEVPRDCCVANLENLGLILNW